MAIETELKLRIAPAHLARLKRHPFLRSLSTERVVTRKLHNVYFDTPDLKLSRRKMALRLRRVGHQWMQTLKDGGEVQAGLHQRNEWETQVAGEALDFEALRAQGARHLSKSLQSELQPLFITDFTRSIRMVQYQGALIELGLDSGEIRAGKRKHTISEIELELKSGKPLALFNLALALLDVVPLEIESTSKAEYGYRLLTPVTPMVRKAKVAKFYADDSVESALQEMVWSCLTHLQANVAGAVSKTDDEYLHQVRVALRRLRVVLRMISKLHADDELDSLRELVAELGVALGISREWDVFATQTLPAVQDQLGAYGGQAAFLRKSEEQRQRSHQLVQTALRAEQFQRLLLRFGAWMSSGYWDEVNHGYDLPQFAAEIMRRYKLKVSKYSEHVHRDSDAGQLHMLRIACKNLRYSIEMFAALYEAKPVRRYLDALTKMQNVLGELNDHAVAVRLLTEMEREIHPETVALVRVGIELGYAKLLIKLRRAWKQFSTQTDFLG